MDFLGREDMTLTLYEYVQVVKDKVEITLEPKVAYQIRIGIAKKAMKLTFAQNGSQTTMGNLHAIEDICYLFKFFGIPHD